MIAKTIFLLGENPYEWYPMYGVAFFATLFIYAIHRVLSLEKITSVQVNGRFKTIAQYKEHIIAYALVGFIGTVIFSVQLSWKAWLILIFSACISMSYVLPVLQNSQKRLRDINHLKIFLVALIWTLVAVILPFIELGGKNYTFLLLSFGEVFLFVFAITIPFDIRDLLIEKQLKVRTIPSLLGVKKAKYLAYTLLFSSLILAHCNSTNWVVGKLTYIQIYYNLGYFITLLLLVFSHHKRSDYYYTGLLDGMMIVVPLLIMMG